MDIREDLNIYMQRSSVFWMKASMDIFMPVICRMTACILQIRSAADLHCLFPESRESRLKNWKLLFMTGM